MTKFVLIRILSLRIKWFLFIVCLLFFSCRTNEKQSIADPVTESLKFQSWDETQQPEGSPAYLSMGSFAKVLCSAKYVSGRSLEEASMNSRMALFASSMPEPQYTVNEEAQRITVHVEGEPSRSATFHGSQGCIIDRPEGLDFIPTEVKSSLPPASEMDWPMGDKIDDKTPINEAKYQAVIDAAFREGAYTAAFLVVKKGEILIEAYGQGAHKDMQLESWSMGKSLTATLIGRLMQQGRLSLDQKAPIEEWQQAGDPRGEITIRNLLNMSSGLRFAAHRDPDLAIPLTQLPHLYIYMEAIDVFDFAVNRPLEFVPGSTGRYRNCDPLTLGKILREEVESAGENYLTWPQKNLFDKIGIREQMLETDIKGNFILTGFDYGTARNWARIALLYLQDGMWMGERLLPEGFADFVATPATSWDPAVYGGQFWLNTGGQWESLPGSAYYMGGGGGQRVIIDPENDMVIVRLGHSRGQNLADPALNAAITALMENLHD